MGYERAALVGRPIYELVVGGPLASPDQWAAQVSAGEFAGEADLVRADGSTYAFNGGRMRSWQPANGSSCSSP